MSNTITLTREQVKQLLILAKIADTSFYALDNEGIPLRELDYRDAILETNIDDLDPESVPEFVDIVLSNNNVLKDVDYKAAFK
jgi:hypothetical protein